MLVNNHDGGQNNGKKERQRYSKGSREFYDEIEQIIQKHKPQNFLVMTGDINTRVRKQTADFEDVIENDVKERTEV